METICWMLYESRMSQDELVTTIFAARFTELMRERELTQQDTSYELRVSPAVINRWVKGKHSISAANLVLICRYFNVSADWLLGLSEQRHPAPAPARTAAEIVAMTDELVANPPQPRRTQNRRQS